MTDEADAELRRLERAADLCRAPNIVGASAVLARAQLRPTWLVPEMIPAGEVVLITGAPGALKSWLAYDLVMAVAAQRPWLGVLPAPAASAFKCAALVFNYDNSTGELGRRFLRLGLEGDHPVSFHSLDVGAPLRLPDSAADLAAIVDYLHPRVVLVDSLRQAHTAEENSSKEMMAVMSGLKRLYAFGSTVIVVHHSGKTVGPTSKSRGSEEIDASAGAVIHVAPMQGVQAAHWAKHRSWPMPEAAETVYFEVKDEGAATHVRRREAPQRKERRP